jgi:hypothetical protein
LAIQWDCAWELQAVCGAGKAVPSELEVKTHVPQSGGYRTSFRRTSRWVSISVSALSVAGPRSRPTILAGRSN